METRIGVKPEYLAQVANSLNRLLADEFLLSTKTKNAHWNAEGVDFYSKHIFFQEQYKQLDDIIDAVGERIRSIGHYADATLQGFLELTHLSEQTTEKNDTLGFMKELLADHESIIIHMRENINRYANDWHDVGSSDFITGLMEIHEKMAWMLRANLK